MLALHSSYFRTLLTGDWAERESGRLQAFDVRPEVMRHLLLFCHTGELEPLEPELLAQLLVAADRFGMEKLQVSGRSEGHAAALCVFCAARCTEHCYCAAPGLKASLLQARFQSLCERALPSKPAYQAESSQGKSSTRPAVHLPRQDEQSHEEADDDCRPLPSSWIFDSRLTDLIIIFVAVLVPTLLIQLICWASTICRK